MSLQLLQPRSHISSQRCESCGFAAACGGLDFGASLFNCFDLKCCGNGECDEVCPNKPDFYDRLVEVRGFRFNTLRPVKQQHCELPQFIPHLPHQYSRQHLLESPWVSISPYGLLRFPQKQCEIVTKSAADLRSHFRLRPDAKIIFRGSDKDKLIENYWAYRRRDSIADQFRNLDGAIFIGPNFSHFGDVVRTDNLFNRMRQLICLEEMSEAGLNVAPHLNDATASDWEFWLWYLMRNPTISIVAKEFQTRCRPFDEGALAVNRLADLQQRLSRELHPIIIGGTQYVELVATRFRTFTLIDCRPVQDGLHYHRFIPKGTRGRRAADPHLPYAGPDALIARNIRIYADWISHRTKLAAGSRHVRRHAG